MIVVELAYDRLERHISAVAQTCKQHRSLIYQPIDCFLWRRIFLIKYDDPRKIVLGRHRLHPLADFDWGHQFRKRVWAVKYLRAAPLIDDTDDGDTPEYDDETAQDDARNLRAISAILSLIDTALPVSVCVADFSPGGKLYHEYWNSLSFESARSRAPKWPASFDVVDSPSLNTVEYHEALAHGLPMTLLNRLNSATIDPEWDVSPLATALYKLVAQHTLISGTRRSYWEPFSLEINMPSLILHKRAYDLRRLKRGNLFGPFLPRVPHSDTEDDVDPENPFDFRADWAYLCFIALIMRGVLSSGDDRFMTQSVLGADALRSGAWLPSQPEVQDSSFPRETSRDWASVEGMWRRLETWLALHVFQHLNSDDWKNWSADLSLPANRARHLVPCRLRIVSYSQDPGCLPGFPTIHFEGETGMEAWQEVEDREVDDDTCICLVDGQTSMLADGTVRWSFHMYHGRHQNSGRQWSFEGVQIGGIGSIVGVIGVWRGADTMGFWWQWKVA